MRIPFSYINVENMTTTNVQNCALAISKGRLLSKCLVVLHEYCHIIGKHKVKILIFEWQWINASNCDLFVDLIIIMWNRVACVEELNFSVMLERTPPSLSSEVQSAVERPSILESLPHFWWHKYDFMFF